MRAHQPIRVLLDATAVPADRGGVGRYVDNLIAALVVDPRVALTVVCKPTDVAVLADLAPTAVTIAGPRRLDNVAFRLIWEQVALPRLARKLKVDVVHSPHYTMPLLSRKKRIVTLHDATFFSDPGVHSRFKRQFFRRWIRLSMRVADACLVPSKSAGEELQRYSGVRGQRVVVAYHGVDPTLFHPPADESVAAIATRLGVSETGWIAFLGTLEPRKNLSALIGGYALVARRFAETGNPLPVLLLAGGAGWDEAIDNAIAQVPAPGKVAKVGYLPADDLAAYLGGSMLMAYPSLGEGFGLPVLEAMACGATVVTTRRLALPEVGGDAVAYTGVDAESIAETVEALLADEGGRIDLSARAIDRAAQFTWERSAQLHVAAYLSAVGES
ncbi:glycosyltransferase family 1 protein [Diaminobutyricimonas sp. LJ205]|uniref:glycosyltransferase family 4 protein n=1 Tax=Diaminobutyricimonas sp. LJ205 TaxID=2683590 RepID=UPI0012F51867|nr:glycosyltransferase family 1 protein [Diaminobutyricimonas sp. LJ205]